MGVIFNVEIVMWNFFNATETTKTVPIVGIDNAKHYAKMCRKATNCRSVMVIDATTGEIIYGGLDGKVDIA